MRAELLGGFVQGEHPGVAEPLPQAGDVAGVAVGAHPVGVPGLAVPAGQAPLAEDGRDLAVGVGAEQLVDEGDRGGGGLAFLPGVERDRQVQGVVLAAWQADGGGNAVPAAGEGDVGEQQPDQALAFAHWGGWVVPQGGEVRGQGADAGALLLVEHGGGCLGGGVVVLGGG